MCGSDTLHYRTKVNFVYLDDFYGYYYVASLNFGAWLRAKNTETRFGISDVLRIGMKYQWSYFQNVAVLVTSSTPYKYSVQIACEILKIAPLAVHPNPQKFGSCEPWLLIPCTQ